MAWHRPRIVLIACLAAGAAAAGCGGCSGKAQRQGAPFPAWRVERTGDIDGFEFPECVLVNPDADAVYVSNLASAGKAHWVDDGNGFLSLLEAEGIPSKHRWITSSPIATLNKPKGMCVVDGVLYVADNTRVMTFTLADRTAKRIDIPGAQRVNDMCGYQGFAYASDTGAGRIYKLSAPIQTLKAPKGVNGITFDPNGRMFAVSWDDHDLYEIDPRGQAEPKPFGLAAHFTHLDGIEVLPDGTFLVSDFGGGKVCAVSPDRKAVATLAYVTSPADIGLDRKRRLLYVPSMNEGKVVVFKLRRR